MEKRLLEIQALVALPVLITPDELAKMGAEYYQELQQGKRKGIYTGIYELDQMTGGLFGGEFCILAARPSMGKCIAGGTRALNAKTGMMINIEDFTNEMAVLSL